MIEKRERGDRGAQAESRANRGRTGEESNLRRKTVRPNLSVHAVPHVFRLPQEPQEWPPTVRALNTHEPAPRCADSSRRLYIIMGWPPIGPAIIGSIMSGALDFPLDMLEMNPQTPPNIMLHAPPRLHQNPQPDKVGYG